jgi:hypothetical protein
MQKPLLNYASINGEPEPVLSSPYGRVRYLVTARKSLTQKKKKKSTIKNHSLKRKSTMQKPLLNLLINGGDPEPVLSSPYGRVRYLVTALAGLGISCAYIMRVNLSVAVMPIADRLWEGGATEQR